MRVLLVSDIHANPFAFDVLPAADAVLCMGDLVDYGPNPRSAIAWCRAHADAVVHGNHDRAIALDEDDGVAPAMRDASAATRDIHRRLLDEADLEYLGSLPRTATFRVGAATFALTHATAESPRRYAPLEEAGRSVARRVPDATIVAVGHTHVQGIHPIDGAIAVNPGSLGMSTKGGYAHYALWEDGRLSLHAVRYDVEATLAGIDRLDLADDVRSTLLDAFRNGRRT